MDKYTETQEEWLARPEYAPRAEYGPTVIRLSAGSERKKARKKTVAGLASLLALGGVGAGLILGSGITDRLLDSLRPGYREEEVAARVAATMTAYNESTQSQSCTSPSRIDPSVVESADYFLARTIDTLEIRSGPDLHSADNIIGRIPQGEEVIVISGPECDGGLMLWEVMARESELRGWTPEIRGEVAGEPLWLLSPIGEVAVGMRAGAYGVGDDEVRQPYFPIEGCAPSRVRVGDYVSAVDSLGIRSYPDVHPADNLIGKVHQGEAMTIVDGPECSWGWLLWEIVTDSGDSGWVPESSGEPDRAPFWLIPIDGPRDLPPELSSNPYAQEAYREASRIMGNSSLSDSQKQERIRVMQDSFGEELVTTVLRYVPVYNSEADRFESFDSYMRGFASDYGQSTSNAPIERDPVGASLRIFFDPSQDTISDMLGLDDWFP